MTRRRRIIATIAAGLFAITFAAALTVYHMMSNDVVVDNRSNRTIEEVALHLQSHAVCLGRLKPGERKRIRLMPAGDFLLARKGEAGTRDAPLGYLYPWHEPFQGTMFVSLTEDSVSIRERRDFSRSIIPRWRSYSVPLQDGPPSPWRTTSPEAAGCATDSAAKV